MLQQQFTSLPILTTDRLTLRPLSLDDQLDIFALRSDTGVNKYLSRKPAETIEDAEKFINNILENTQSGHSLYWAIDLTSTKTFVGTICLFDLNPDASSCEIGFELKPSFQGQGLMTEAVAKIIDFAILNLPYHIIIAWTHKDNQPSIHLLEKMGFHKHEIADTNNVDLVRFEYYNLREENSVL